LELISLLILGVVAGVLAGLLGIGGGVVIVPALVFIFSHYHSNIPSEYLMHFAVGTSLATIVLTALSSIYAHHQHRAVRWQIVKWLTPGLVVGTLLGAAVADSLSSNHLQLVFGIFLIIVAIQMAISKQPPAHRQLPNGWGIGLISLIIGKMSALVGIGGASMNVPFLTWCNVPVREAVGTAAACGLPIAIAGTLGFIVTGWSLSEPTPAWSLGYVYLPAFMSIVATSLIFAPLGAKLTHSIPVNVLKRFFALFLLAVGIKMLLG